ncbi:hypothetical protein MTR67_036346 [Solanum verrucosum]|uniref:Reverse transcriptase domain-containing protein n=1 Tax=Solanum verrucosum TaxID=315347 RepID=A0AAF0ZKV5_SOLVR|nr:hypothetical protein MTR67_036346 [Solanum verrucosum]
MMHIPEWKWERIDMDFVLRLPRNLGFEDMLRVGVIDFSDQWSPFLPLSDFAYNNNCHASIEMTQFEVLYGRTCRSPIDQFDTFEVRSLGTKLLREVVDNIRLIQDGLLMAQSRQKSYTNQKIRDLKFMIGDRGLIEGFTHKEFDKI